MGFFESSSRRYQAVLFSTESGIPSVVFLTRYRTWCRFLLSGYTPLPSSFFLVHSWSLLLAHAQRGCSGLPLKRNGAYSPRWFVWFVLENRQTRQFTALRTISDACRRRMRICRMQYAFGPKGSVFQSMSIHAPSTRENYRYCESYLQESNLILQENSQRCKL